MDNNLEKDSETKPFKLPIIVCFTFICEDSNTCKSIFHIYANFYLNFACYKYLRKEFWGVSKGWLFWSEKKKLPVTQIERLVGS